MPMTSQLYRGLPRLVVDFADLPLWCFEARIEKPRPALPL